MLTPRHSDDLRFAIEGPEVDFISRRCSRCGSPLISDGKFEWCSFVGDQRPGGQEACTYGVVDRVPAIAETKP